MLNNTLLFKRMVAEDVQAAELRIDDNSKRNQAKKVHKAEINKLEQMAEEAFDRLHLNKAVNAYRFETAA